VTQRLPDGSAWLKRQAQLRRERLGREEHRKGALTSTYIGSTVCTTHESGQRRANGLAPDKEV
jgi:hypothetical protein